MARRVSQIPPFLSCCELLLVEIGRAKGIHRVLQYLVQGWEQEELPHWWCIGEFAQAGVLGVVLVAVGCWLCEGLDVCMGQGF